MNINNELIRIAYEGIVSGVFENDRDLRKVVDCTRAQAQKAYPLAVCKYKFPKLDLNSLDLRKVKTRYARKASREACSLEDCIDWINK